MKSEFAVSLSLCRKETQQPGGQCSNRTSSRYGKYVNSTFTLSQTVFFAVVWPITKPVWRASSWNGSSAGLQQALRCLLTGLGFLLGVDGFKFALASSQGARLLPFLDKSCPLMARVGLLFTLILPPRGPHSLTLMTSPPWSSLSLARVARNKKKVVSLARAHLQFEFSPRCSLETTAAANCSW